MSDVSVLVRDKVLPLILPSSAEELQDPEVFRRSLGPGVELTYAVHAPVVETWFGIRADHLEALDLADEEALHALALRNLGALDVEIDQHDGFAILFCPDLPAASFALRPDLWRDRVSIAKASTALTWAADPSVLLCIAADAPHVRETLDSAAAALLENGVVEGFLTSLPWVPGDPPKALPWSIDPSDAPPAPVARAPEDGPPEQPFALHVAVLLLATLGPIGGISAWRPLTVDLLGDQALLTTGLSLIPFLFGAVGYGLSDGIRPSRWRAVAKLSAWAAMGAYAVGALVLHLTSPADASPMNVGLAVAGALACTWYVGGYGAWLVRRS